MGTLGPLQAPLPAPRGCPGFSESTPSQPRISSSGVIERVIESVVISDCAARAGGGSTRRADYGVFLRVRPGAYLLPWWE